MLIRYDNCKDTPLFFCRGEENQTNIKRASDISEYRQSRDSEWSNRAQL